MIYGMVPFKFFTQWWQVTTETSLANISHKKNFSCHISDYTVVAKRQKIGKIVQKNISQKLKHHYLKLYLQTQNYLNENIPRLDRTLTSADW